MADVTVSSDIDTFMQALNKAEARTALGAASAPVIQAWSGALNVTVTSGTTVLTITAAPYTARVVTLPAASGYAAGVPLRITDLFGGVTATNTISIARAGSDTINGGTANVVAINVAFGSCVLVSNGSNAWVILSRGMAAQNALALTTDLAPSVHMGQSLGSTTRYWDRIRCFQVVASVLTFETASSSIATLAASPLQVYCSLQLHQLDSLGLPGNNSARIGTLDVGGTAEIHVVDEAGNVTQISEHSSTAPSWMYVNGQPNHAEAIKPSWNEYTGVVTYRHLETGAIYKETFEEHNSRLGLTGDRALSLKVWEDVQAELVAAREAERTAWQSARDEWESLEESVRGEWRHGDKPELLVAKPRPAGLTDQRAAITSGRQRETARASLRARWSEQPSWIRGPFAEKFAAASRLLDLDTVAGDHDARDLILYADAPSGYDTEQRATFSALKLELAQEIEALRP